MQTKLKLNRHRQHMWYHFVMIQLAVKEVLKEKSECIGGETKRLILPWHFSQYILHLQFPCTISAVV